MESVCTTEQLNDDKGATLMCNNNINCLLLLFNIFSSKFLRFTSWDKYLFKK